MACKVAYHHFKARAALGDADPWYGYRYTDEHIPTERLGVPTAAPAKCECGSGSNEASGAHSHWCPRWVSK